MTKRLAAILAAGILILVFSGTSRAISVIDTLSSWDGSSYIGNFGEPNTSTYGQTFTVTGIETVLDNFTFYVRNTIYPSSGYTDTPDFEAYVYTWDGNRATGPALFQSAPMTTTTNNGFEAVTINTGGINLTSGSEYVAFFTCANLFDGSYNSGGMGGFYNNNFNYYTGGDFVFLNNGSNFGQITTDNWYRFDVADLAFTMNFSEVSAVPEPSTLLLLGSGLLGLVGLNRRRKA